MIKIFLVILLIEGGHEPVQLEDIEQPDIAACLAAAGHVLEQARAAAGTFEFVAQCSVVKMPGDPA